VVLKALQAYDLSVHSVSFFTIATNTLFKIRSTGGEKYVMRIYSEEETTLRENRAEMFWLETLMRDTDLRVTEPVRRRDGEYINVITVPGVPAERRCVLFKWIPGRTLESNPSVKYYFKYGQALAKLHEHAHSLKPLPEDIQPKRWDKVFYYPDEPVIYDTPAYRHLFSPQRIAIINDIIDEADTLFKRLFADEDGLSLIHGDLHFWNVHVYRGELYLIDFEDVMLGYPVQDVAVALSYGMQRDGYEAWRAAFQRGYSSVRPWPAESVRILETLVAARNVMFINYVARVDASPEAYIERRCADLSRFLQGR
jgi:Ser/Thr protein kinase RdoA (MazF antagonist)